MTFHYHFDVYEDLKLLDTLQAHMLLDYFEKNFEYHELLSDFGCIFRTGDYRILFHKKNNEIVVLRIIK